MIKVYGSYNTRASRTLWMLEELGQPYELISTTPFDGTSQKEEYASVNPNQKVPTLVDGDFTIWESMAINFYLAEKYDNGLQPKSPETRGEAIQWAFWAMTEAESDLLVHLFHRVLYPEEKRDSTKAEAAAKALQKPLAILDKALEGKDYLVENRFTVADLNVASIFSYGRFARLDMKSFENVSRWLKACMSRPAFNKGTGRE